MLHYSLPLNNLEQGFFEEHFELEKKFLLQCEEFEITDGEVMVDIEGERTGDLFDITIFLDGEVEVPCSRCNAPLKLPLACEQHLIVKLGDAAGGDGDEEIIVPRTDPSLRLDNELYSLVVTSIPMYRTHPEGQCSEEVEAFFHQQEALHQANTPFGALLEKSILSSDKNN